ncbi:MAG: sigma-70 family RNA polymerase sigma factor [Kiloniellaceae bacterium]
MGSQDEELSPESLLTRVARQDRAAYRRLYDLSSSKLFGVALRICRERSLAEEAFQEAFIGIWRTAADFDPLRGSALAWMAGVTRNRSLDLLRKRGRGDRPVEDDEIEKLLAEAGHMRADQADLNALLQCLERLEETPRQAVMLAYCAGLTRDELAARFAAPANTVKTWLRRALQALRGCLEE